MEPETEVKQDLQLTVKLVEKKEGAQHSVTARMTFNADGKEWYTNATGQGASRADAVENLSKAKLPSRIKSAFLKHLLAMDAADPKAVKPLDPPAISGEDEMLAGNKSSEEIPSAESNPPEAPSLARAVQANSIPREMLQGKSVARKKVEKTTPKPDGTAPEPKSNPPAKSF